MLASRPPSVVSSKVLDEFKCYINKPIVVDNDGNFNIDISPAEYWKMNRHRFPSLSPIARDILGVPSSSANIERLYSTAVDILSAKRNNLKLDMFEMLFFILKNSNLVRNIRKYIDFKILLSHYLNLKIHRCKSKCQYNFSFKKYKDMLIHRYVECFSPHTFLYIHWILI